ncbi:MAG: hypothetical protein QXV22_03890 [Thermoplasmataceae archaeon]
MNYLLLNLYLHRYLKEGKPYFLIGIILPILFLIIFIAVGQRSTAGPAAQALTAFAKSLGLDNTSLYLVALILPFVAPVFTVVGTMMAPALYSEDRENGFFEFILSSTRTETKDIFWAIVLTAVFFAVITILIAIAEIFIVVFALNRGVPSTFAQEILIYTLPISIIAVLIGTSIAFVSQALTKKMTFVNSPAGLAPVFGVIITVIPLFFSVFTERGIFGPIDFNQLYLILASYVVAAFIVFLLVFLLSNVRMARERFLS